MTNYKVFANSNSNLTRTWASIKSQQNIGRLPILEQKNIAQKNKSWIMYFNIIAKLGLITSEEARRYRKFVLDNRLHGKPLTMEVLKNA
jgi:hypothetical protein